MSRTTKRLRRGVVATLSAALVIALVSRCSSSTPELTPSGGRTASLARLQGGSGSPEPRLSTMPRANDRIDALVSEHGIPPGSRESLVALAASVDGLRARESASVGDRAHRDTVAAERRAVSKQTREVLESLPPAYRAAMRRNRISARQLAAWTAEHP